VVMTARTELFRYKRVRGVGLLHQRRSTGPFDAPVRFSFFRFDALLFFNTPEFHLRRSGTFVSMHGRRLELRDPTGTFAMGMRG
jgi:hypothetical protein